MISDRLRDRLTDVGMSQSELARRTKLTQGTIAGLVTGRSRSSSHLHKIARELGTTPAYLTGETDDPDQDAPDVAELTFGERQLLESYRALGRDQQRAVVTVATSMTGRGPATAINAPTTAFQAEPAAPIAQDLGDPPSLPPEHALQAMFAALLSVSRDLDEEGTALALAQHLPRALAQAADVHPDPAIARTPPVAQKPARAPRRAQRK